MIIFAWLKMGQLCESPFDGDENFDIDLKEELELNIWMASVTLEP